jgi:hypothetical protein
MMNCNDPVCFFYMPANAHRSDSCGERSGKGRLKDLNGCDRHSAGTITVKIAPKKKKTNRGRVSKINIARLRRLADKGYTQIEIAKEMGCSESAIYRHKMLNNIEIKDGRDRRRGDEYNNKDI